MKINNKGLMNRLSQKILNTSKTRNYVAILAIIMTTLLFTAMFTIVFSLNSSYQTYTFRQIGGYAHGTFKNVTAVQKEKLLHHPKITAAGERILVGLLMQGGFSKVPAEISYMDENCAKWSYISPTVGRLPIAGNEIAMDLAALETLGIEAKIGEKIYLTYEVNQKVQNGAEITDEFVLVGFWDWDSLLPVHVIHVSEKYAEQLAKEQVKKGLEPFPVDLNIMFSSSFHIRENMEKVKTEVEPDFSQNNDDKMQIGVNWGYTTSQISNQADIGALAAMTLFLGMVIATGYLIIANIFQISVSTDIRLYGLLKTIGFTGKQLRKIIFRQAVFLCGYGIPIGSLLGYGLGSVATPYILERMNIHAVALTVSSSYWIFILSGLFSGATVFLSCLKPARLAGRVSPVEAVKYVEKVSFSRKTQKTKGGDIRQMALANIARNRKKGIPVMISLTLSLILFNALFIFVTGFDMEKYLEKKSSADFIVAHPGYFHYRGGVGSAISEGKIKSIQSRVEQTISGSGYQASVFEERIWITEKQWLALTASLSEGRRQELLREQKQKGELVSAGILIEGLDEPLWDKVKVIAGDLRQLKTDSTIALVLSTDDYGNPIIPENYPAVGDQVAVDYVREAYFTDSRTGEPASEDTAEEWLEYKEIKVNTVDYEVAAYITIPYAMGFRYSMAGYQAMLPVDRLERDSGSEALPLFYLFDTPDSEAEVDAEDYLKRLAENDPDIMYESKNKIRKEFHQFKDMFLLLGSLLCGIIGFIGILNYFNVILTSCFNRKREFAVLQAIGMTEKQLKKLLLYESGVYIVSACALSIVFWVLLYQPMNQLLEKVFWFFKSGFTLTPILITAPILAFTGWIVPFFLFRYIRKISIVSRIQTANY
ncbi:FtsX-like permease family protein [Clostridiales bacterium COT073_COT-073]|nr:FtsX-like permease family protein [Clostridiales bacterium COT073_COT-073]